jgi:hypothetical protein
VEFPAFRAEGNHDTKRRQGALQLNSSGWGWPPTLQRMTVRWVRKGW